MNEEINKKIDTSQSELETQKKEEKVSGEMRGMDEIFFGRVDNFQNLQEQLHLDTPESIAYFEKGLGEVNALLLRAAARGKWLTENPDKKEAFDAANLYTMANELQGVFREYQEILGVLVQADDHIQEAEALGGTNPQRHQEDDVLKEYRAAQKLLKENYSRIPTEYDDKEQDIRESIIVVEDLLHEREIHERVEEGNKHYTDIEAEEEMIRTRSLLDPEVRRNYETSIIRAIQEYGGAKRIIESLERLPQRSEEDKETTFNTLRELGKKLTVIKQRELIATKYRGLLTGPALSGREGNQKITMNATPAFEALPQEQQTAIMQELAGIRIEINEQIEAASCPEIAENFWQGQAAFNTGQYELAEQLLKQFLEQDINSKKFKKNEKLQKNEAAMKARAEEILKILQERISEHKDFFEAQKVLQSGDIISAKKMLKAYIESRKGKPLKEGETDYTGSAKELLTKIALIQVEQVRAKLEAVRPKEWDISPKEAADGGSMTPAMKNQKYIEWEKYSDALAKIEAEIKAGKYDDYVKAFRQSAGSAELSALLNANHEFNFLRDETELERGREGYLALARKYHENDQYELAEQMYMLYFGERMQSLVDRNLTFEKFMERMDARPNFHSKVKERIEKAKEEYDARVEWAGEIWAQENPWSEGAARSLILGELYREMRTTEAQNLQQDYFRRDIGVSDMSSEERTAWKDFANMKGIHLKGTAYEPFGMSDAEVDALIEQLPIDIALIAISGGVGGIAGGFVSRKIMEKGATQLAKDFMIASVRRRFSAYAVGLLVENTVFTASNTVLNGIRTGHFEISPEMLLEEWESGLMVLGGLGLVGRASRALVSGEALIGARAMRGLPASQKIAQKLVEGTTSYAMEGIGMGVMHGGQLTQHDLALILGLKLGHKAPEAAKEAKRKIKERRRLKRKAPKRRSKAGAEAVEPAIPPMEGLRPATAIEEAGPASRTERPVSTPRRERITLHEAPEASEAFVQECMTRLMRGTEEFLRWKEKLQDPHEFAVAEMAQAKYQRERIRSAQEKLSGAETWQEANRLIEEINASKSMLPGAEWEIVKNLNDGFAVFLGPDGMLHLMNSSSNQYNFRKFSQNLKRRLRRWDKLEGEERTSQIRAECEFIRKLIEGGKIPAEKVNEVLSESGNDIAEILRNPSAENISRLSGKQIGRLRRAVLKLRNEGFRVDRARSAEKAKLTVELSAQIQKTLQEQIEKNPDMTREEFYSLLDLENNPLFRRAEFTEAEIAKIRFVVDGLFEKSKAIRLYYSKFKDDPKGLFREVFGFEPKGEVEIGMSAFSLYFNCKHPQDYIRITNGSGTAGEALPYGASRIHSLDGTIVAVNRTFKFDSRGNWARREDSLSVEEIVAHEDQHNVNKYVFRALQPEYHGWAELPSSREFNRTHDRKAIIKKYLEDLYQSKMILVKDEILAFLRTGESWEKIQGRFRQGQSYDLWKVGDENRLHEALERRGQDDMTIMVSDMFASFGKSFRAEVADAIRAAKRLNDPGLLMVTDIRQWRFLGRENKPERRREETAREREQVEDTAGEKFTPKAPTRASEPGYQAERRTRLESQERVDVFKGSRERTKSEQDYTQGLQDLVIALREGEITKEEYINATVERIKKRNSPKKIVSDLMDLMFYDTIHRKDSPYGDYFSPELVRETLSRLEGLSADQIAKYETAILKMRRKAQEKLKPHYQNEMIQQLREAILKIHPDQGSKKAKLTKPKLLKLIEDSNIPERARQLGLDLSPFLNSDYTVNMEHINKMYDGVSRKAEYSEIDRALTELGLTPGQKQKVRDHLEGKLERLNPKELGVDGPTFGKIKKMFARQIEAPKSPQEIRDILLEVLSSKRTPDDQVVKPSDRETVYRSIIEEMQREGHDMSEISDILLRYLIAQNEMQGENTRGTDGENLRQGLNEYSEHFDAVLRRNGMEDAVIVPLLGDGEPLAIAEWARGSGRKVELAYVSRKTMMTAEEYAAYQRDLAADSSLADRGRRLDEALVYSTIYHNRNGKVSAEKIEGSRLTEAESNSLLKPAEGEEGAVKFKAKTREELIASEAYQRLTPEKQGRVLELFDYANEQCLFNKASNATKEYVEALRERGLDETAIERMRDTKFISEFTKLIAEARQNNPAFRAKTDQIFETQVAPIMRHGKPLVFVDSGMKGTIPSLLAALVKIRNAQRAGLDLETYMSRNPNDVAIFVHSVDPVYRDVVPHLSEGRTKGKPIEDAGKFGRLNLHGEQVKIGETGPKETLLAALDLAHIL